MNNIVLLKDASKNFGGKAYGLSQLISANVNIPMGFAISNDFIYEIMKGNEEALQELKSFLEEIKSDRKLAVRSSADAEDGSKNSYAGMFETKLNVNNDINDVTDAIKFVYDSSYSDRVKSYAKGNSQKMNIVIQEMVQPEIAGVAFTNAIDTNGEIVLYLECVDGLADKLVSGEATPARMKIKLNSDNVIQEDSIQFSGRPLNIEGLKNLIPEIQNVIRYFKKPMDLEWCIDKKGTAYLVQARPITAIPLISKDSSGKGILASPGIAKGKTYVIDITDDDEEIMERIKQFPDGAIMVATATETEYLPAMKKAKGIITEEGSALSHAAIVSRELGIPCIAGYPHAKEKFKTGTDILLDASNGKIVFNNKREDLNKNASFNFGELYCFDNIFQVEIDGVKVLIEPTMDGIAAHLPDDANSELIKDTDFFVRKNFGNVPMVYQTPKYLWYFELERFKKLPLFGETVNYAEVLSRESDAEKINKFYNTILERITELVRYKNAHNISNKEKVYIEEICMANHFILDAVLPNGFAEKYAYFSTLSDLSKCGKNFNNLLNNEVNESDFTENLKRNYTFLKCISKKRNEICQQFIDAGAMRIDYFDDREQRMMNALNITDLEMCHDIVDMFYASMGDIRNTNIENILKGQKKNIDFCSIGQGDKERE